MTFSFSGKQLIGFIQTTLLVLILGLLIWSKPWSSSDSSSQRKITVTGESIIEAEPDKYTFNPYFEAKGSDQNALKDTLTKQANEAVTKLKEIGIPEEEIKLDVSSYDQWYWKAGEEGIISAYLQIQIDNKDIAQEVQDYLLTTGAKGQLTSQSEFSEQKRSELDNQAVDQAIDDAKSKADAQAKKLGAKIGKVIEVSQTQNPGFPIAYDSSITTLEAGPDRASLPVLPGKNEYRQTVTVTYELQ